MPGILVMTALFGASMTGSNLLLEIQTGSHERMLVTPLSRSSLLVGRALKEIVPLVAQAAIIVVVVIAVRLRAAPGRRAWSAWLMLAVFGVGLGALSYALAMAVAGPGLDVLAVQQTLLFPLLLLSGMLLPLDDAPGWMRVLSELNPLTYVVDAERALFAGDVTDTVVLWGLCRPRGWPWWASPSASGPCSEPPPDRRSARGPGFAPSEEGEEPHGDPPITPTTIGKATSYSSWGMWSKFMP